MEVAVDTHALFWYLSHEQKLRAQLTTKSFTALESAKRIYIPTIVLLELQSIFEKYYEKKKFTKLIRRIKKDGRFRVVALDLEIVDKSSQVGLKEIHDRVIVATASVLKVSLVSRDHKIKLVYPKTIW